jgi:hypothetical protein
VHAALISKSANLFIHKKWDGCSVEESQHKETAVECSRDSLQDFQ